MAWPENVDRSQLRIEFYRGSGAGGQKRNKTSSACRITHLPTKIATTCEAGRSQSQNRATAFSKLAARLVPLMKVEQQRERYSSDKRIRTYHEKRGLVTDHRTDLVYPMKTMLDGDLDEVHRDLASHRVQEARK